MRQFLLHASDTSEDGLNSLPKMSHDLDSLLLSVAFSENLDLFSTFLRLGEHFSSLLLTNIAADGVEAGE